MMVRIAFAAGALLAATLLGSSAYADDQVGRTELKRADLSGAPGMEVISSILELKPGDTVSRHTHHGVESGYVIQGGMIQVPGKAPVMMATGSPILNLRDVPHGGFKVVGDTTLKIFTVHIVDKGKALYEPAK